MKTLTKKEARKERLSRHYEALDRLYLAMNGRRHTRPTTLSCTLLRLEQEASRYTTAYCNGEIDEQTVDKELERIEAYVAHAFGGKLHGFFINRDPRGYALKISDEVMRNEYAEVGLERDWGGYGLLAPRIE